MSNLEENNKEITIQQDININNLRNAPENDTTNVEENASNNVPEGIDESGVEIGSSPEIQDENDGIFLGDRYKFETTKYGTIKGRVYYLDASKMIRIMPDGVTNRVYDISIVDDDLDPDIGVTDIEHLNTGPRVGFITWQGFRVDQEIYSFKPDGTMDSLYTIVSIKEKDDKMIIKDQTGAEIPIDFDFKGIPLDLPFTVLAIKTQAEGDKPMTQEEIQQEELDIAKAQTEGANSAEALGEDIEFEDLEELDKVVGTFYIPDIAYLTEIPSTERIYPELLQKSEFLTDLISILDIPSQRNPLFLKRIRALVEIVSSLKNSIVNRTRDGVPNGERAISVKSLADLLKNPYVPIVRPVLNTKRVLMANNVVEQYDTIVHNNLITTIINSSELLDTQGNIPDTIGYTNGVNIGIPRWYQALNMYFNQYPLGDEYENKTQDSLYTFSQDSEYFRGAIPGYEDLEGLKKIGKSNENDTLYEMKPDYYIGSINHSLRRGHGPTYRGLEKGGTELIMTGDKAETLAYVVFPYKAILSGAIGATRTGALWDMILRSSSPKVSMKDLLESLDGIKEERDAQNAFFVKVDDADAIGISFSDFINLVLQSLVPRGSGDLSVMKYDLGISESEFTTEQNEVIQERVKHVIASLRTTIRTMREKPIRTDSEMNSLLANNEEFIRHIKESIKSHSLLEKILKNMELRTPGYKNIDVAIMGSLLHYAKDYTFAVLAGNTSRIKIEEVLLKREYLLNELVNTLRLNELKNNLGHPPQINPCEHVNALETIRRVKDDSDRMSLLIKFINLYKGKREDNWINCSICKQHLVCHHEILEVQQFLHPSEKDIIQKQIVLDYAGGLFGSNYICRNCGLPIAELDFDKNIEYDDTGKPMARSDPLEDIDFVEQKELSLIYNVRKEGDDTLIFNTEKKKEIYGIARVIADTLGVAIDSKGYHKIVDRGNAEFLQIISADGYKKLKDASKEKKMIDYTKYVSRIKIGYTAALVLLEIQTHKPDYVIQSSVEGCQFGFGGFPLVNKKDSEDNKVGLKYVACAVSGIQREDLPWTEGFQLVTTKEDRRSKLIMSMMEQYLTKLCDTNVSVQKDIDDKTAYTKELLGDSSVKTKLSEILPSNFLPRMEVSVESAVNSVKSPSIPEGASGSFGEILKADAWIRGVNKIAKEKTIVVKRSPFLESSCCFSPITAPGKTLREANLPPIPELVRLTPSFFRRTILYTPMIPRTLHSFNATPALSSAYRVFLKLCWKGPRIGLPHEFGYDLKCDWCDTVIFPNYLNPEIVIKNKGQYVNEDAIRSEFDKQSIPVTDKSLQALLDAANIRTKFEPYRNPIPPSPADILEKLGNLEAPPVEDWSNILQKTQETMDQLAENASDIEIINALSPLRNSLDKAETLILQKLGKAKYDLLNSILQEAPEYVFEVLRSYFLVPAQRVLSNYNPKTFLGVKKYYNLSPIHVNVLNELILKHTEYLNKINLYPEDEEDTSMLKAQVKLDVFVLQMSEILKQSKELRISRLKYQKTISIKVVEMFLKELIRTFIFGPLSDLLNPESIPDLEDVEIPMESAKSDRDLLLFVNTLLNTYKDERLSYNPIDVRQKLEESKEREKQKFIGDLDKIKDPDLKRIELIKKNLGLGKWAIGGTKLVYAYDPNQWEKNREELLHNYATASGISEDVPHTVLDDIQNEPYDTGEGGYDNFDNHGDDDNE